jgi:hypothetical protein
MSKKHFRRLAWELSRIEPENRLDGKHDLWQACCEAVAQTCAFSNDRFDRRKFLDACHAEWWQGKKPPM